ncbi:peptidoglycan-binding protein [Nocardioides sp. GXZ039]|uniref:peptidoglycan-binding protein n=1 Tax=Nocardioides sp. GXZ039 TaxID=3136018 RepID=UPI0030F3AEAB
MTAPALRRRTFLGLSAALGAGIAVGAAVSPAAAAGAAWSNPVLGPTPTTYSGHLGWDIPSGPKTPVYAAADGTVVGVYNGCYRGHKVAHIIAGRTGNGVWLKHADGRYSYYGHLTVAAVALGQVVSRGQYVGSVGNTGNTLGPTGNHLHFEIHWGPAASQKIDAKAFLAAQGVRLASSTPVGSTGFPSISQGASGGTVKVLQRLLNGEGRSLLADGGFGAVTTTAVRAVQGIKGLVADGLVGDYSWAAFTQRLVSGASGAKVGALQEALNNHGAGLLVDGGFGGVTRTAVASFQSRSGLVADGVVGPVTWSALI